LPEGIDSLNQKFLISACYDYETIANPIVCIDPGLYKVRSFAEACTVGPVSGGGGQGAPVAVSSVDVDMAGENTVAFKIYVSNVGGGTVLRNGLNLVGEGAHSCPYDLKFDDYNVVNYDVTMSGGSMIKCSPAGETRLVSGRGTIACTFSVSGDSAYTTPLRIKLRYGYTSSITKSVTIVKTP
jgi:hypothetical protein